MEQWWNYTDRENRSTGRKTCHSVTLPSMNPGRRVRPTTNRLSQGTAFKDQDYPKFVYRSSPYRAVNTLRLCYKNQSVNAV
jgi:hypothetical protein